MRALEDYWYRSNALVWLLLPLSWLYCLIALIRRELYQLNIKESFLAEAPVVIVGNIVVGGSGKTPLLIALCEYIKGKGYKPGVVSRGYGGNVTGVRQVLSDDNADLVGDEPLMISLRTGVPVVVGVDRVAAIDYLLENNQCDIVLSDDGLQHYRMKRDLEFAVIDADRKFGNGFCLPAGPMREPVSRLDDVDIVVYSGIAKTGNSECGYNLRVTGVRQLNGEEIRPLSTFAAGRVHAVAGIGHPQRFFTQLTENGLDVIEHAFPDHQVYSQGDFSGWHQDCIIMTEKDAVKCRQLNLNDAWVVLVDAEMTDLLEQHLDTLLMPLLKHRING